jgi:hypothetical protein
MARQSVDIGLVVALSWLGVAVGLSVVLGPQLGMRGWLWLGAHHLLCGVGCAHELWRAWQRRAPAPPTATPPDGTPLSS